MSTTTTTTTTTTTSSSGSSRDDSSLPLVKLASIEGKNTPKQCLIALHGFVYDITSFLDAHPGGADILLQNAGGDGTAAFSAFHPLEMLSSAIGRRYLVGRLAGSSISPASSQKASTAAAAMAVDDRSAAASDHAASDATTTSSTATASNLEITPAFKSEVSEAEDERNQNSVIMRGTKSDVAGDEGPMRTTGWPVARCTHEQLARLMNIASLEHEALRRLPPALGKGYIGAGAGDEASLHANRAGFSRYALRPRVLRNVTRPSTRTMLLSGRIMIASPIGIAPFAAARTTHPDGESALAFAAGAAGTIYVAPHYGGTPLSDLVASFYDAQQQRLLHQRQLWHHRRQQHCNSGAPHQPSPTAVTSVRPGEREPEPEPEPEPEGDIWLQFYPQRDMSADAGGGLNRAYALGALKYAASLGVKCVVVTVDTPNNGNRERTFLNPIWAQAMHEQCGGSAATRTLDAAELGPLTGASDALTWDDVTWMAAQAKQLGVALIVKGIMTGEDTALAAAAGCEAIIISNHGGRQIDGTEGTIEVVNECAAAATGRIEVYVDGGFRRGRDIFKALALGARAVFVGRPALWGLALGGQPGAARALTILNRELTIVMQLCGARQLGDISISHLSDRHAAPHL